MSVETYSLQATAGLQKSGWYSVSEQIKEYFDANEQWIQHHLQVSRSEWVRIVTYSTYMQTEVWEYALALKRLGQVVDSRSSRQSIVEAANMLAPRMTVIEQQQTTPLATVLTYSTGGPDKYLSRYTAEWPPQLTSVRLSNPDIPVVLLKPTYVEAPGQTKADAPKSFVIRRCDLEVFLKLTDELLAFDSVNVPYLYTYDTESNGDVIETHEHITSQSWEGLILHEKITQLVSKDVDSFYKRKEWFKKNHFPFRRGYLFHGPPGNGKTSLVRALMTAHDLSAHTLRLSSRNINDQALEKMFKDAGMRAPSVILLEDLDRAFPRTGDRLTNISVQALLNCMDGVTTHDGVITIATANEPTALDKAILKRPGRFDRTVLFPNPDAELRARYFHSRASDLSGSDLTELLNKTEGFSFAQLQENYIIAGQIVYERGVEDVEVSDLIEGADVLRSSMNLTNYKPTRAGFSLDKE